MTPPIPWLDLRHPSRGFVAPLLAMFALLAAGCGGSRPLPVLEPPGDENGRFCPLPLVFSQGQVRPVRIRIENRMDRPLLIFIDRCYHHTRMADVPPGRIRQPSLPERLVAFPEGLRFHAFDGDKGDHVGVFTVPMEERPVLHLVLDEKARSDPDSLATFLLSEDQRAEMAGTWALRTEDEGGGWAALWANPGAGILTWSCVDDRRGVTLGTSDSFTGDAVDVRVRRDDGGWVPLGAWPVQRGIRDALVVPEELHPDLRRWFAGRAMVDLVTEDREGGGEGVSRSRRVHRFETDGLEEALAALGCWGTAAQAGSAGPLSGVLPGGRGGLSATL